MYKIPNPPHLLVFVGVFWNPRTVKHRFARHWNFGCWHERQDSMDDLIGSSFHRTFVLGSRLCAVSHGNLGTHTRTGFFPGKTRWYLWMMWMCVCWYEMVWNDMNVGMSDWLNGWMDSIDACMDGGHDRDHGIYQLWWTWLSDDNDRASLPVVLFRKPLLQCCKSQSCCQWLSSVLSGFL